VIQIVYIKVSKTQEDVTNNSERILLGLVFRKLKAVCTAKNFVYGSRTSIVVLTNSKTTNYPHTV